LEEKKDEKKDEEKGRASFGISKTRTRSAQVTRQVDEHRLGSYTTRSGF